MTDAFTRFADSVRHFAPRTAIVLGSGLAAIADHLPPLATCDYSQLPDFVAPTVAGHRGQLVLTDWNGVPAVLCLGRVHFYEGHPWGRVTRLVDRLADWQVTRLILTNAAGGLRHDLNPGDLMAITGHAPLLTATDWKQFGTHVVEYPWCAEVLPRGVYAALTGPCYETPAEIRALNQCGVAAVGMSTAREAERALELGMQVAGISCITNKAAGITGEQLSHTEVEQTAKLALSRLRSVLAEMVLSPSTHQPTSRTVL
jgi:purine-nucleoside phosphorylase